MTGGTPSSPALSETVAVSLGVAAAEIHVAVEGNVSIEINIPVETNVITPVIGGRDGRVASAHGSLATILHDCRGQKALFHIIHAHAVHTRAFHSLKPLLNCLETRLVAASSRF